MALFDPWQIGGAGGILGNSAGNYSPEDLQMLLAAYAQQQQPTIANHARPNGSGLLSEMDQDSIDSLIGGYPNNPSASGVNRARLARAPDAPYSEPYGDPNAPMNYQPLVPGAGIGPDFTRATIPLDPFPRGAPQIADYSPQPIIDGRYMPSGAEPSAVWGSPPTDSPQPPDGYRSLTRPGSPFRAVEDAIRAKFGQGSGAPGIDPTDMPPRTDQAAPGPPPASAIGLPDLKPPAYIKSLPEIWGQRWEQAGDAPVEPQIMREANERAQQIRQQQPYLPPASAMAPPPQGAVSSDLSPFATRSERQASARGTDLESGLPIQPDRFGAGMYGFANANGPLQAIAQMIGGLKTGQRQDAQGIALRSQNQIYEAMMTLPGMTKEKARILATNPKAFEKFNETLFGEKKPAGYYEFNGIKIPFTMDQQSGGIQFLMPGGAANAGAPATLEKIIEWGQAKEAAGAATKATATKQGEVIGTNLVALPAAMSSIEQGIKTLDTLASHPGRPDATGAMAVLPGVPNTRQRAFIKLHDQVKGQSFLAAYQTLKGGGAITKEEGEKATDAINRLDRAMTKEDYNEAIKDLRDVMLTAHANTQRSAGLKPVPYSPGKAESGGWHSYGSGKIRQIGN